ncbi:MAG: DUF1207 domain-containing protein [Bacteroidia bacterium]
MTETQYAIERHLVPIYAADSRAHRLGIQRNIQKSEFIASMGGQLPVYFFQRGRHKFQFEVAGTTYLSLLRSVNHGSVLNTDFFADVLVNYQWHQNWAIRMGTGHTSQHLSDDAIANAAYPFKNYARDYHQIGLSYKGNLNKYHLYSNFIYNYNFKTDRNYSGSATLQAGFESNLTKIFSKSKKVSAFILAADVKLRGEQNLKPTTNFLFAYQFNHMAPQKIRLLINYTTGADERGQFYLNHRDLLSAGIHVEF